MSKSPVDCTPSQNHIDNQTKSEGCRRVFAEVKTEARDQLFLSLDLVKDEIQSAKLSAIGCLAMLKLAAEFREKLNGKLDHIAIPEGKTHEAMMLRELVLKIQGKWNYPYKDDEVCHCRAVATQKVDAAVLAGCHSVDAIKRATSASTSCGSCSSDIEAIIRYRVNSNKP